MMNKNEESKNESQQPSLNNETSTEHQSNTEDKLQDERENVDNKDGENASQNPEKKKKKKRKKKNKKFGNEKEDEEQKKSDKNKPKEMEENNKGEEEENETEKNSEEKDRDDENEDDISNMMNIESEKNNPIIVTNNFKKIDTHNNPETFDDVEGDTEIFNDADDSMDVISSKIQPESVKEFSDDDDAACKVICVGLKVLAFTGSSKIN